MTAGFINYWEAVPPQSPEYSFAQKMVDFVNPVVIGRGMRIFKERKASRLIGSTAYPSGVVVSTYQPVRKE
jgi:hypothetical protein